MSALAYPLMFRLKQKLPGSTIEDVASAVEVELRNLALDREVKPGASVAIACGSRKIANHALILKSVASHFKQMNARPFLVPAMGLHAGGIAEAQLRLLSMLGITEEAVGAEIRSSMDVELLGSLPEGVPVYCDRHAAAADHIFLVNRVRPHSALDGEVQSGLLKMLAMGLGKKTGALIYHRAAGSMPFADLALGIWDVFRHKGRLLAGLMLVENGQSKTARVQGALAADFAGMESKMLRYARSVFPKLPFGFIDILLVDEIGPAFGCHGVDLNVVGRKRAIHGAARGEALRIQTLVFRGLHPTTMGNGVGMGHADMVRSRLVNYVDSNATCSEAIALTIPSLAAIPMHFETDREIIDAGLSITSLQPVEKSRIVWIRNTASLAEFECSEPFLEEVAHWKDLSVASELHPLEFDGEGNLRDFVTG
jgi:hypothetical protein